MSGRWVTGPKETGQFLAGPFQVRVTVKCDRCGRTSDGNMNVAKVDGTLYLMCPKCMKDALMNGEVA